MISILSNQLKNGKVFHAYLILSYGDHHQLVEQIISLFDIRPVDRYILKAEGSLKISEIREIQQFVKFSPLESRYKLVFIPEAQNLTLEAQNALLKTLEEPPGHSIVILIAQEKSQLLDTILSRCQEIRFADTCEAQKFVSLEEIRGWDFAQRSQWAEEKSKELSKGDILDLIDSWLLELKEHLVAKKTVDPLLRQAMECRKMVRTNTSARLILENIIFNV